MVEYLKIKNIGPIREEVVLNFEVEDELPNDAYEIVMKDGKRLLKLAYIYGANASGKTTVLKAFDLLRKLLMKPGSDKAMELDFDPFLFCDSPYETSSSLELAFYVEDVRYIYDVVFNKLSILEEKIVFYQTAKPTELFSRTTDVEKRLAKINFGSRVKASARDRDLLESNTLHNNTVMGAFTKTNVDIPELENLNRWFSNYLLSILTSAIDLTEFAANEIERNPAINDWMNTFLNKADNQLKQVKVPDISDQISTAFEYFDSSVKPDILIKNSESVIIAAAKKSTRYYGGPSQRNIEFIHDANGKSYPLSIIKESSGTKRYFGLGGLLYKLIHGNHLLCIDELETSLHPDLMKYFLQMYLLNGARSQLLVTTHNTSLLGEVDFIRRDALWFSEKQGDGSVRLYSAADFDSTTLRKDASLINAYKSGRLGAKPNLGSPYFTDK